MKSKKIKIYMCGTTWLHELGETTCSVFPNTKFDSHECGVVECEVTVKRWVKQPNLKKQTSRMSPKQYTQYAIKHTVSAINEKMLYLKRLTLGE